MSLLETIYSTTERVFFRRSPKIYRSLYSLYKTITDRYERRLCRSLISPGDVVVDVGANIGIYTEFFANLVGANGKVHAFEPEPTNFYFLSRTLSSKDNIFLYQGGVGRKNR